MSPADSKRMVVASLVVVAALTVVRDVAEGRAPTVKEGLGIFVAGLLLTALAEPLPTLAGGIAGLVGVSAVLHTGAEAFGAINKGVRA